MNLHSKQYFIIAVVANTDYNEEEAERLWEMMTTDTIDLLQEMSEAMYKAGYKASEEDRM